MPSKIVMLTCYDATFAKISADAGCIDYLLVGDSLGMVIQGEQTTQGVTMDQMIYHTRAVRRGRDASSVAAKPAIIGDMPYGSYDTEAQALLHSRALLDAGADMVKVEGPVTQVVESLVRERIPVCGHIGLTPQTILNYKVQGKSQEDAKRLLNEAIALEKAGCSLLVLEMIPLELAKRITEALSIPTIGIGAGKDCSGQVLVVYDLLGLNADFNPKFLKKYADASSIFKSAMTNYAQEVRSGDFPDDAHSFHS